MSSPLTWGFGQTAQHLSHAAEQRVSLPRPAVRKSVPDGHRLVSLGLTSAFLWLQNLVALKPWVRCSPSLCLSVLICEFQVVVRWLCR